MVDVEIMTVSGKEGAGWYIARHRTVLHAPPAIVYVDQNGNTLLAGIHGPLHDDLLYIAKIELARV
jgi:hypothetical protein